MTADMEHTAHTTGADVAPDPASGHAEGEEHPRGTMAIMLAFIVVIAVLWGWVYLLLLARG
jgi:hypothetical protein